MTKQEIADQRKHVSKLKALLGDLIRSDGYLKSLGVAKAKDPMVDVLFELAVKIEIVEKELTDLGVELT